jgi:pre-mRNA-splicing factor ATP-dependent RNA helicase DHX15/PRP43
MSQKRKIVLDISSRPTFSNDSSTNFISSDGSAKQRQNPWTGRAFSSKYYEILSKRQQLPVYEFKDELQLKVSQSQVVIIEGETGSGKTTQVNLKFYLSIYFKINKNIKINYLYYQ